MDHWQVLFRLLWIPPEGKRIMPVANAREIAISLPAVSANDGARRYIVLDECCECVRIATRNISLFDARYNAKPEAPSISECFDRNAAFMSVLPFRAAILGVLARPNFDGAHYRRDIGHHALRRIG